MCSEGEPKIQIIVFPYHGQSHVNTMLQLSKRLAWKGAQITIATTFSTVEKLKSKVSTAWHQSITFHTIYDDTQEGDQQLTWMGRMSKFEAQAKQNLPNLILSKKQESNGKCLLVYDGNLYWALDIAHEYGVRGATIVPHSCATIASYYCLYLETQGKEPEEALPENFPSLDLIQRTVPNISGMNFPDSVVPVNGKEYKPFILYVLRQCTNLHRADMLFFNQFDKLAEPGQMLEWMSKTFNNVKTLGPTIPSGYIDKRIEHDTTYDFNEFNPDNDACINWLNTKPARSVLFIAFGSSTHWNPEQMAEIAEALREYKGSFLWALRKTEQQKLPIEYFTEIADRGMVMGWCNQLDVLSHEAIECFMTHSGWTSVVEALSLGVPMLSIPHLLDQAVDAHYVERVWGGGIIIERNEEGMITRQEISRCLKEMMESERGKKIKENAARWKVLAKEALSEGGSNDEHIDEILEGISSNA